MSQPAAAATEATEATEMTFASGRYLKRKRTQVNYRMEELDFDDEIESGEEEAVKPKVRQLLLGSARNIDVPSEATQDCSIQASTEAQHIPLSSVACRNPQHDL